ncbi:MAG: DUF4923 family protein [Oscillospiraceae bacterium]|nr:DUF4923 family protein [Oscillospiraceae bacterium]
MANEDNKDLLNFDSAEKKENKAEEKETEVKKTKKNKKPKTAIDKKKLITIIVAVVLVVIILPSGIYCIVHKENPVQMLTDTFSSSESQLVGKWQGASGVSAYEFNEDGTYKSYISSFDFSGTYTVDGKKLTLYNTATNGSVEYKINVTAKKLTLTLTKENGVATKGDEKDKIEFDRVDSIKTKSISDIIDQYTTTSKAASTTTTSAQ